MMVVRRPRVAVPRRRIRLGAAARQVRAAQMGAALGLPARGMLVPGVSNASRLARRRNRRRARAVMARNANGNGNGTPAVGQLMSAPLAVTRVRRQSAPSIAMAGNGERCVVAHREYVGEVSGATAFTATQYVCQPALQTLFVWLATIAGNFEKYRFRRLRFIYETENATSQGGTIIFSFDYDPLDAAPVSKQEVMSNKVAARCAPWQEFALEVPVADMQRDYYYTRSGSVPSGADQKLYDVGQFIVCTQGASGASGEIYVEYEVELITPQANTQPTSARFTGSTSLTATALVGADAAYVTGSNIGWTLTDANTLTCTVAGTYLFAGRLLGTVMVATTFGNTGTATNLGGTVAVDTAATTAAGFSMITAQVGQTYEPTISSATTVTSVVWRIARYNAALA